MQVLGQWVVLTKTTNLLPRGGVIAPTTFLILGNRRKLVWETQREIMRSSLNHWCSSWKKSKGCITLGRKVYSSAIIGGIGTLDCTLSVTHGADSAAEGCGVACSSQKGHHCFGKQGWSKQQTTAIWCAWKVCYLNIRVNYKILTFFHSRHSTIRISSNEARFPSPIWPSLSVLLPLLCGSRHLCLSGVAAPKPLPLQL